MSAWAWLVICWAGVLGGFVLGAWWATGRAHGREADDFSYIRLLEARHDQLEDEVQVLREARKAEWERKIDAGDTS